MNERRVRFTETASDQVDRERIWWLANRDSQELFATELENALRIAAVLPGAGHPIHANRSRGSATNLPS